VTRYPIEILSHLMITVVRAVKHLVGRITPSKEVNAETYWPQLNPSPTQMRSSKAFATHYLKVRVRIENVFFLSAHELFGLRQFDE
jgi:hypothetical protein